MSKDTDANLRPGALFWADQLAFTQFRARDALFEASGVDIYSAGITDWAIVFSDVSYLQVPTYMEFIGIRVAPVCPKLVPNEEGGIVYEFFDATPRSTGGMFTVSEEGALGATWSITTLGYIVAEGVDRFCGSLPSGNVFRPDRGDK